jgi:NAD(P)-dependent dehydrogenase (short-subunit alcohol dehydrogenase family)
VKLMTRAQLSDKVIVVTGASGIAAAGASRFAREGACVFVISRSEAACAKLANELDIYEPATGWAAADLTDEKMTAEAFATCLGTFGRIDGLFAVAGGSGRLHGDGPLHDVPLAGWKKTLEINGDPAFLAARETLQSMMERDQGGAIVFITSVLASSPVPDLFATHSYAAIKGAEIALTTSLAAYYAPMGIRVNAIAPGLVDTPMAQRAATDESIVEFATRKQPLAGGLLDAADVANTGLFLLSDESRTVTGQTIAVDGGWSVTGATR